MVPDADMSGRALEECHQLLNMRERFCPFVTNDFATCGVFPSIFFMRSI